MKKSKMGMESVPMAKVKSKPSFSKGAKAKMPEMMKAGKPKTSYPKPAGGGKKGY